MGQNFRLVAPREKLFYHIRGKLGELLIDHSGDDLVNLLAVPVRPPIPPSTTAQSPRGPPVVQVTTGSSPDGFKAGAGAKRKADGEMLADSPRNHKQKKTGDHGGAVTFSDLPREIHQLVFDQIVYMDDIVCLGLTSKYFWTFAREEVHKYMMSLLGQWAGHNIVCVGDNVKPNDYPPGAVLSRGAR